MIKIQNQTSESKLHMDLEYQSYKSGPYKKYIFNKKKRGQISYPVRYGLDVCLNFTLTC